VELLLLNELKQVAGAKGLKEPEARRRRMLESAPLRASVAEYSSPT
jgi:hypothetical protein